MVEITCNESGIKFEAATRRTKQHPLIADAKAKANKDKMYSQLNDALATVRREGGYTTIEEFMARVNAIMRGEKDAKAEATAKRLREDKAREDARQQARANRYTQNLILRKHGYTWHKVAVGTEDDVLPNSYMAGVGELSHYRWELSAPDGRIVTVAQAMAEIEKAQG